MYNTPHKNSSMTSEEITKIIDCEFQRVKKDDSDYSMAHGAMGVALFMIWYGQKYGIHRYIDDGLWLIDSWLSDDSWPSDVESSSEPNFNVSGSGGNGGNVSGGGNSGNSATSGGGGQQSGNTLVIGSHEEV